MSTEHSTPQSVIDERNAARKKALDELREVRTDNLDRFRADLPHIHTSDLIGLMLFPDTLVGKVVGQVIGSPDDIRRIAQAAMAALGEEIDRRCPLVPLPARPTTMDKAFEAALVGVPDIGTTEGR